MAGSDNSADRGRRATVRDVARVAGVSPMTVSRVLNGYKGVTPATAARVRTAMTDTGFRLNRAARNLRQGHAFVTIGLVVDHLANPFYSTVSHSVEEVAHAHDALVVVSSCGEDPARERAVVEALFARGLDGLLLYPTVGDHSYLEQDVIDQRPIVFLGRPPGGFDGDTLLVDNIGGAKTAVEHLVAHGHTRIGVVTYGDRHSDVKGDPRVDTRVGRFEGYRRALLATGLRYDPELVRLGCANADEAATATRQLLALPDPPTALFTMNNRMTVGALRALGSGLGGIALVGFDDFELADVFDPPITVVTHNPYEMGKQAAELLFSRLRDRSTPARHLTLPMTLVKRGSGERPPPARTARDKVKVNRSRG